MVAPETPEACVSHTPSPDSAALGPAVACESCRLQKPVMKRSKVLRLAAAIQILGSMKCKSNVNMKGNYV